MPKKCVKRTFCRDAGISSRYARKTPNAGGARTRLQTLRNTKPRWRRICSGGVQQTNSRHKSAAPQNKNTNFYRTIK